MLQPVLLGLVVGQDSLNCACPPSEIMGTLGGHGALSLGPGPQGEAHWGKTRGRVPDLAMHRQACLSRELDPQNVSSPKFLLKLFKEVMD